MIVLLDTDHFSILQHEDHSAVAVQLRLEQVPPRDVCVSIVSFQEQARGWLAFLHRVRKPDQVLRGFFQLQELLRHYHARQLVPFDQPAMAVFLNLQRQRIRIGTSDRRIAAIAKVNGMKLLSRYLRDFRRVPGLDVEDWTL